MKKTLPILIFSSALITAGGITFTSCSNNQDKKLTPITKHKRAMNPKVPNIIVGDFRLQILDDSTVRFEHKYQNPIFGTYDWLDDDTLFVPNRTLYEGVENYEVITESSQVIVKFGDIEINIPKNIDKNLKGIKIYQNSDSGRKEIYSSDDAPYDNTGELPKPADTKEAFQLIDYPRIIEPPFGYSTANLKVEPYRSHLSYFKQTSGWEIQDHRDIYVTFPRKSAKALRQQYRNLTGPAQLVRLSTLGAWDSRYYPYNDKTAQQEIDKYYENHLPLDNLIIDTDWRAGFDGKGYFINETLFPNMEKFLKSVHNQNIEVCFNDHPEPQRNDKGEELDVLNTKEVDFREQNLKKIINMGLDTWWYDRNWSTSLICPGGNTPDHEKMLNHESWGDYLYNNVTRQAYMEKAMEEYEDYGEFIYKRPMAMSNVIQIRNGHWEGFTDSMSHRYSIQWTGDQNSTMLESEVANVVKTGIDGMPYMSSDLAGHTNPVANDYHYQRWIQYGALSPIFRIHCTRDLPIHTQPWLRPASVLNVFRDFINLRYRLLPLYYSLARESYDNGLPICRALGFEYQNDSNVANMENEYLIGKNILFAPCVKNDIKILNPFPGEWENGVINVEFYKFDGDQPHEPGEKGTGVKKDIPSINLNKDAFKDLAISAIGRGDHFSARFEGNFTPSETLNLVLNADDGVRVKIKTPEQEKWTQIVEDWSPHAARDTLTNVKLEANKKYNVEIEYYQLGGDAELYWKGYDPQLLTSEDKEVYLPEGKWLDLFHGNIYDGGKKQTINYKVNENAIFVRLGSMTPLIANAQNTKELDWTNLVYDVYPTTDSATDFGDLYEDDFETVAYENDFYHKSHYSCGYDQNNKEFIIKLDPSQGWFIGDDAIANRKYKIRIHKTRGEIGDVLVDGKVVNKNVIARDASVTMPFNFSGASRTEDVVEIEIPYDSVRLGHIIQIKLS